MWPCWWGALLFVVVGRDQAGRLAVQPASPERASTQAEGSEGERRAAEPTAVPVGASSGSGPVLPDADFAIVAADHEGWRVIDVATGAVTGGPDRTGRPDAVAHALRLRGRPRDQPRPRTGRRAAGRARWHLGEDRRAPSDRPHDRCRWSRLGCTTDSLTTSAAPRRWSTPDGSVRERIMLPTLTVPAVGIGDALVVTTKSGTALVSDAGSEPIRDEGVVVAADARRVAHVMCDETRSCEVVIGTMYEPDQHRLPLAPGDVPGGYFGSGLGAFSPDGRWLAFAGARQSARGHVAIIDTGTGERVGRPAGSRAAVHERPGVVARQRLAHLRRR